jgi:hypothetical protein
MQFGQGAVKKFESIENVNFKKEKDSFSPLLMYNGLQIPDSKIEIDEFATLALERFSVLQLIENVGTRFMKGSNDYINKLSEELRKIGFLKSILCSVSLYFHLTCNNKLVLIFILDKRFAYR